MYQLSIGTLAGALAVAPIADRIGRKYSMSVWSTVFVIGVIIQMASETSWVQIAIGRLYVNFGDDLSELVLELRGKTCFGSRLTSSVPETRLAAQLSYSKKLC